jgi:hypothetical protein
MGEQENIRDLFQFLRRIASEAPATTQIDISIPSELITIREQFVVSIAVRFSYSNHRIFPRLIENGV